MSKKPVLIVLLILMIAFCVYRFVYLKPSQTRNWSPELAVLAQAEINENLVTIRNVRNFTYRSETEFTPAYYDRTYDLNKLKRADYAVVPFGGIPGLAHTFMSFEFEGDQFVSISIEVRKQIGERYSILRGLVKPYELIYVVGDEQDVVKLRTNYRTGEEVRLYPVKAEQRDLQAIFLDYMQRVNELSRKPEFYNIFTKTCTTDIVKVINRATDHDIPLSYKYFLPAFSDEYALERGLLDVNMPIEAARTYYSINERAKRYANDPAFSRKIRSQE